MSHGCFRLSAHSATHTLKQRLDPPETLARDPKRRDSLRRFCARRRAHNPPLLAPPTLEEIGKIFLEAF
jgi:hypothetical protein